LKLRGVSLIGLVISSLARQLKLNYTSETVIIIIIITHFILTRYMHTQSFEFRFAYEIQWNRIE